MKQNFLNTRHQAKQNLSQLLVTPKSRVKKRTVIEYQHRLLPKALEFYTPNQNPAMLGPSSQLRRNLEMSPQNRGALPFQRKAIAATSTCHRLEDCFHLPTQLLGAAAEDGTKRPDLKTASLRTLVLGSPWDPKSKSKREVARCSLEVFEAFERGLSFLQNMTLS